MGGAEEVRWDCMGWEMVMRGCDGVGRSEKMRDGVKDGAGAWLMILTILVSFHELRIADNGLGDIGLRREMLWLGVGLASVSAFRYLNCMLRASTSASRFSMAVG